MTPIAGVYQRQDGDLSRATAEDSQPVPGDQRIEPVGRAGLLAPEVALRHTELLRDAAASKRCDLAEFDAHRSRVLYSVLGSTTRVYYTVA